MSPKYSCLEDRVLIRPIKPKELEVTAGGIVDPNVKPKPVLKGEVISAGQGFTARDTGVFVPTLLSKGDIVLYGSGAGLTIDIDKEDGSGKEEVLIMREGDCFLVISKK
jgi:co-chaperonin GroES (HSP10)